MMTAGFDDGYDDDDDDADDDNNDDDDDVNVHIYKNMLSTLHFTLMSTEKAVNGKLSLLV